MSLLDDLQEEVRKIRAQENQQNDELREHEEFYRVHLHPVMVKVYEYFAKIVENLNIAAPEVWANYPLDPLLKEGVTLKQSHYRFRSDSRENPRQIDIFCKCALMKPHEFYLSSQQAVLKHVGVLDGFNFPYHRKNRLDRRHDVQGASFLLEGPMLVHVRIAASPSDRSVHIGFRNVEAQPVKRSKFPVETIDEAFLERLAKVLLRQVPQLVEVAVDENFRNLLRYQINQDNHWTEHDLAQAALEREAARRARKDASLINRTKRSVTARVQELVTLFSKH